MKLIAQKRCPGCQSVVSVWQDEGRTMITIEEVYATRLDCPIGPG